MAEPAARIATITYRLPRLGAEGETSFATLAALLAPTSGVEQGRDALTLVPRYPVGALPRTIITLADVPDPQIIFAPEERGQDAIAVLHLTGASQDGNAAPPAEGAVRNLPLATIVARLHGRVTHVDHTGVNLSTATMPNERWDELFSTLAGGAALYAYPGGEPWPFILPTSDQEFAADIATFAAGRTPKFELVHDARTRLPIIQIALNTTCSRGELEALFPAPYGVAFSDLGDIFRTVYAEHPWAGLRLRIDLNYAVGDGGEDHWGTGRWLVEAGGRLR